MEDQNRLTNRWKFHRTKRENHFSEEDHSTPEEENKQQKFNFRLQIPSPQHQFYFGSGKFYDR